jgi:class 3 adenylate cyclase/tetratricopeptide (TPR) repeat protein
MQCATPLQAAAPVTQQTATVERRIVTILFVDLVGFTARSDQADPEDVRRTLVPFHERVKNDLERFGGTLDKFIGDAALGVFGSPVAHEDDPERAVRAALRILDGMVELRQTTDPGLAVRIAVNTGEAVVTFGTGPQVGEAVAGDVVNTTSRMQALAPHGAVVIGERTLEAVRDLFDVEALPPAMVKGKIEPITVWRVLGERAEQVPRVAPATFVGRAHELALLHEAFDRATRTTSAQLVAATGEPGIGKSRLVEEFRRQLGDGPRWVTGRCVPYGEAVTFAPVAAIVRQLAGIGPADDAVETAAALERLAAQVEAEPSDREWLASRLEPIVGVGEGGRETTIEPEEIAQAWARILSWTAQEQPLVVHLDDLHWAEPVLLDVVDRVTAALHDRPVLLLCTARPEVLQDWTVPGAIIDVPSLTGQESAQLLTGLLSAHELRDDQREALLKRTGGNPLYALEFARMLGEREAGQDRVALPASVQAVIAARLDSISSHLRALLQDASIVGTAFWLGALVELGERERLDVEQGLETLTHRGLVQRAKESIFQGQPEFGFTHALIGEVAYMRIPRTLRARGHRAAGRWIERSSGDRAEERAEMLARHFATAVELAEASGEQDLAEQTRGSAVRWLIAAGDRAGRLDSSGAFAMYDRAHRIAGPGSRGQAEALERSAHMGRRSGSLDGREVLRRYEEALVIYRRERDPLGTGRALIRSASQLGALGENGRARELIAEAIQVLEAEAPSPELARAYAFSAEDEMFAGHVRRAMELADRALELLEGPAGDSYEEIVTMSLHIRGDAKCSLGDLAGLDDLREALRVSEASANPADIVTSESYLGDWRLMIEGPTPALRHYEDALAVAERRGIVSQGLWMKGGALEGLFDVGNWDRALQWCEDLLSLGADRLDGTLLSVATSTRSRILLLRGARAEVTGPEEVAALARSIGEMQAVAPGLIAAAELAAAEGTMADAVAYVEELERVTNGVPSYYRESRLGAMARVCAMANDLAPVERMLDAAEGLFRRDRLSAASARAVVAEAMGDPSAAAWYGQAAAGWRAFPNPLEEGLALLGRARCRRGGVQAAESALDLARGRELLGRLGMPDMTSSWEGTSSTR